MLVPHLCSGLWMCRTDQTADSTNIFRFSVKFKNKLKRKNLNKLASQTSTLVMASRLRRDKHSRRSTRERLPVLTCFHLPCLEPVTIAESPRFTVPICFLLPHEDVGMGWLWIGFTMFCSVIFKNTPAVLHFNQINDTIFPSE